MHPDACVILMFRPHRTDPTRVHFRLFFLVKPSTDPDHKLPAYVGNFEGVDFSGNTRPARQYYPPAHPDFGGIIMTQDYDNIACVQRGLGSRAYKGMRLSEQEQRMRHYLAEIERYVMGKK